MDKDQVIAKLREHEDELRAAGVQTLSLFGSVARGEATDMSDVDVVVRLDLDVTGRGLDYFSSLADLKEKLETIVGKSVDIVSEPVQKPRLAREITRDRQLAF
ncbi:nucleotidyltransferase domain-containing protein [Neorhizobium sp. CSC1952]|uniref:nucleotidyltransferase family protein n=1 Tax=Neorhizobium sp. CSC1952 TaxID=2978974 RepID=UPI0025A58910|nr:nucleotidyltransferase domain-containing protein [Rhizobium sp. CSC1952]WJR67903.1 nucleotidyltransferase domain-containing protein [Rhizobium sp. CSC1952]